MSDTAKHFLDLSDLSAQEMRDLVDAAHMRKKANPKTGMTQIDKDAPLSGHVLAMLFEKPSTRTRLSFDLAMRQLGGDTIILNPNDMQLGRGETIADTARVMSRYANALMVRTNEHAQLVEFAAHATIPIINGLTAFSHPCQIIADIMTFEDHKGAIKGQKLAWFGDGNNVATSFIHAACLLDFELHMAIPHGFFPPQNVLDWAQAQGGRIEITQDIEAAAMDAAALITDCWVSLNDAPETAAARKKAFAPYQITERLMARGDAAIFMHCLPAYRGQEVTNAVIDGGQSVIFDEAENRIHAQKAILDYCLGGK